MPLRRVFVFLMAAALFAPPFAHAAAVRAPQKPSGDVSSHSAVISIAPGLYTLKELAAELSTPGVPVRVDPALAHRLGFICLKNRSQTDALHAVESAFALKAQPLPAPATGLVLVLDPDTAIRERRWLNRFVSSLQTEISEEANDYAALLELSPEQSWQELGKRNQQQAALASKTRPGTPSEQAFLAAYDATRRAQKVVDANNLAPEQRTSGLSFFRSKSAVSFLVSNAVRSGFGSVADHGASGEPPTFATFSRGQDSYSLEIHPGASRADQNNPLYVGSSGNNLMRRLFGSVKANGINQDGQFAALLGSDATEWLKAEQNATETFIATEAVGKPFRINSALPSDAVSSRVWQWCIAFDKEAVLEVIPSLDTTEAPGSTFAYLLRYRDDWSARDENGVAVLTNRLVFLDRSRAWELGALQSLIMARVRRLETSARTATSKNDASFSTDADNFPISLLPVFSERVWSGTSYGGWEWPGVPTARRRYYHYQTEVLDGAAAIGLLWTNLSKAQQEGPPGRTDIPLTTFSPPTLRLLAQWFVGTGTLSARQPAFVSYLRQYGHLYLERASDGRHLRVSVGFDDAPSLLPTHAPHLMLVLDE